MMARRGVMGVLAGAAAALLVGGCGILGGGKSYRFRMTVEVETPQGIKTGSSVLEVRSRRTHDLITGGGGQSADIRGEAVIVELPGRRTLFALLKTVNPMHDDLMTMSMKALDPAFDYHRVESAGRISAEDGIRSPAEIAPSDYPLLVTFRDIRDPASLEKVDPGDLAASFGPGVRLRRIAVEVTDDGVTTGIEKRLGWLPDVYKILRGTDFKPKGIPVGNFKGLFSTELSK